MDRICETPERGDFVQLRDDISRWCIWAIYTFLFIQHGKSVFAARSGRCESGYCRTRPITTHPDRLADHRFVTRRGKNATEHAKHPLKELKDDIGIERASQDLPGWARACWLLNRSFLTVEEGNQMEWLTCITDKLVELIASLPQPIIFVLWGRNAQELEKIVDGRKTVFESCTPKPIFHLSSTY